MSGEKDSTKTDETCNQYPVINLPPLSLKLMSEVSILSRSSSAHDSPSLILPHYTEKMRLDAAASECINELTL